MRRSMVLLAAIAISSSIFSYAHGLGVQDSQNKLNGINKSIQQNKDKLSNINEDKKNAEKEMENLDKSMNQVASNLKELNGKITSLDYQIKQKEIDIHVKRQKFYEKNKLFKERVRAMYQSGNSGYLDIILNSKNFSDAISRIDMVKRIIIYDKALMADIKDRQKSLEENRFQLENNKNTVSRLKNEADEKYKSLQSASNEKKQLVQKLENDKNVYENMISKEQSESQQLEKTVQQMKNESSRIVASRGGKIASQGENISITSPQKNSQEDKINPASKQASSAGNLFPVTEGSYPITSPFGMRFHPVLNYSRLHAGMDLGVPMGTPIYALKDGVIIAAQSMSGYGNVVMINHGDITSVYAHNSSLVVSTGQKVKGGQLISYSGNSGVSSGPHLHFEIRNSSGQPIEPSGYYVN